MERVSIIGLGKLGIPMAASIAAKGIPTIGVDVDSGRVEKINLGEAPIFEPGLDRMLEAAKGRLTATTEYEKAVLESDATFIVVPTPSELGGGFSTRLVTTAVASIAKVLKRKAAYHLVVLTSTVMPGTTDGQVRSALEAGSGKRCGADFGLCYNPEFIALGSVLRDFLNPDLVLIGESDAGAGDLLVGLHSRICENKPPFARMNFVSAELTKLAINTFVTTKISYANTLARICEKLSGADVDVVTSAIGLDSRIGKKYLKGAIGYGGPCFPRDNFALAALARTMGAPATLPQATDSFNRSLVPWLAALVRSKLRAGGTAGILGLAYKPESDVVEESPGLQLAQALVADGTPVVAYDPAAMENAARVLGASARMAKSARECIQASDAIVLATPWREFRALGATDFRRDSGPRRVFIDCWRLAEKGRLDGSVEYLPLGIGLA